jgi:hypothetical protein
MLSQFERSRLMATVMRLTPRELYERTALVEKGIEVFQKDLDNLKVKQELFNNPIMQEVFCPHEMRGIDSMRKKVQGWMQDDLNKLRAVLQVYKQAALSGRN